MRTTAFLSVAAVVALAALSGCKAQRDSAANPPAAHSTSEVSTSEVPIPVTFPAAGIVLAKPIDCDLGSTCFIQQYADHDPGPGVTDYMCRHDVYDAHDGTDFRLPDKVAQARGVAVLAAADGVVVNRRDGEPDWDAGAFSQAAVNMDKACGNGVLIKHADGWETQYCHLRQGSVTVQPGQAVTAGTRLGMVGQSGDAAFVHLHVTVRKDGKAVDPFAFGQASCGKAAFLWAPAIARQMAYHDRQILNTGFTATAIGADDIERGGLPAPTRASPALVVYIRAIGLNQGDVQSLVLYGPDDSEMARSVIPGLDRDKAQYQMFVGKKLTMANWPAGRYRGVYTVTHGTNTVLTRTVDIAL